VARENGAPYVYGGSGPADFDCSGLVQFVYAQLGWALPHNAEMQYEIATPVALAALQPGDLLFFPDSTGQMGHVGIYAGTKDKQLMMWDAPETGQTVQLQPVWTTDIKAGRLS
jgi:peptidoglycan DL-endopeptidase CwlO